MIKFLTRLRDSLFFLTMLFIIPGIAGGIERDTISLQNGLITSGIIFLLFFIAYRKELFHREA